LKLNILQFLRKCNNSINTKKGKAKALPFSILL